MCYQVGVCGDDHGGWNPLVPGAGGAKVLPEAWECLSESPRSQLLPERLHRGPKAGEVTLAQRHLPQRQPAPRQWSCLPENHFSGSSDSLQPLLFPCCLSPLLSEVFSSSPAPQKKAHRLRRWPAMHRYDSLSRGALWGCILILDHPGSSKLPEGLALDR